MKNFYKKFFLLMIPMALKELISSLVNLIDTIMVGQLGETAIAAVGIGNQVYFLFTVFLFGISCGAGVFASQFWGTRDIKGMRRILGLNLILSAALSLFFVLGAQLFPRQIFQAFKANPAVMAEGISYLRIVSVGYLATGITIAFDMSVCCSENAGLPFLDRAIGLVVNIFFNWVLIFGKLGAPALGVQGAAIATVIARVTEMVFMIAVIYGKKMLQAARFRELFDIPKALIGKFWKTATPVILNEMAWALGITTYSWIFARISADAMVVITIVQNIERLMLVFFHGGGNAAGVFIGKAVGAGQKEEAFLYAKRLTVLTLVFSAVLCGIFVMVRPLMLLPYEVSEEIYKLAMDMLLITAILMIVKSTTFLLIVGVFRNGGDTRSGALIDIGSLWGIGVPAVALSGLVFGLPLIACYAIMSIEEIVKLFFSLLRFRGGKWIRNVVE